MFDFLCVLFYVAEVRRDNPSANLRSLMLFANQISAKDAILAGEIQRFAGLADKYVKNGKMGEFRPESENEKHIFTVGGTLPPNRFGYPEKGGREAKGGGARGERT